MTKNAEKSYLVREITRTANRTRTVKPLRGVESSRVREFAFLDELYIEKEREKREVIKTAIFFLQYYLEKKANSRTRELLLALKASTVRVRFAVRLF